MGVLVGIAGHSGAGKTTAGKFLETIAAGAYLYLGQAVIDDIQQRGQAITPAGERETRLRLRKDGGADVLVNLCRPRIEKALQQGAAFVDAVFSPLELERLRAVADGSPFYLLRIEADFALRAERLSKRAERPSGLDDLRQRDALEKGDLALASVFEAASHTLSNDGTMTDFENGLTSWWSSLPPS